MQKCLQTADVSYELQKLTGGVARGLYEYSYSRVHYEENEVGVTIIATL